jgi:hypothetical protein
MCKRQVALRVPQLLAAKIAVAVVVTTLLGLRQILVGAGVAFPCLLTGWISVVFAVTYPALTLAQFVQ